MFRNGAAIEYREAAVDAILRVGTAAEVLRIEAESAARQQRLEAERAVDSALADSFPASDPPSWTWGIARPRPAPLATRDETAGADDSRAALAGENTIDVSRAAMDGSTFRKASVSLAGAVGIVLLVPFVILLIGMPVAVAVRGVVEAASWLLALISG